MKSSPENTISQGNTIHFNLTHMADIAGILANTGAYSNTVTAGELRYIRDNWSRFANNVKFYQNNIVVTAPL